MRFHEIEPGVWVVPDMVTMIDVQPLYNGMSYEGFAVRLQMAGGGEVLVRRYSTLGAPAAETPTVHSADGWRSWGRPDAREVALWIDERRESGVTFVSWRE